MRPFLLAALLFGTLMPQPAAGQPTAAFERFADEIVVFGPNDFLYGFRRTWLPPETFLPIQRFAQFLDDRAWRADDFLPLLSHRDAKVRTLALVALYNLEDPALLPRIFALVDDAAQTFSALQPHAGPFPIEMTPQMLRPADGRGPGDGDRECLHGKRRLFLRTGGEAQSAGLSGILEGQGGTFLRGRVVERSPRESRTQHEPDSTGTICGAQEACERRSTECRSQSEHTSCCGCTETMGLTC